MSNRTALQIIRDEHMAVAAVLRSLLMMIQRGPEQEPDRFFDVLRAMLFYIDEFPEQKHHPKESDLLFPHVARACPELMPVISKLEEDHRRGEGQVRQLQHLLLAWELLGASRREAFVTAAQQYVRFYLEHMRQEEMQILPAADQRLQGDEWAALNQAFEQDRDPLAGGPRDPAFDKLFTRIVNTAPSPIGVGA
jgi:hemerythrin-like domain-containing protein